MYEILNSRRVIHDIHRLHLKIIDYFVKGLSDKLIRESVGKVCKNVPLVLYYNSRVLERPPERQRRGGRRVRVVPLDVSALAIAARARKFLSADGALGADDRLFSRAGAKSAVRGQKFTANDEAALRRRQRRRPGPPIFDSFGRIISSGRSGISEAAHVANTGRIRDTAYERSTLRRRKFAAIREKERGKGERRQHLSPSVATFVFRIRAYSA